MNTCLTRDSFLAKIFSMIKNLSQLYLGKVSWAGISLPRKVVWADKSLARKGILSLERSGKEFVPRKYCRERSARERYFEKRIFDQEKYPGQRNICLGKYSRQSNLCPGKVLLAKKPLHGKKDLGR